MWKQRSFVLSAAAVVLVVLCSCQSAALAAESESDRDANQEAVESSVVTTADSSAAQEYQRHHENINQLDDDEPVSYDGAQVWRLGFSNTREKNAVAELQHEYGK